MHSKMVLISSHLYIFSIKLILISGRARRLIRISGTAVLPPSIIWFILLIPNSTNISANCYPFSESFDEIASLTLKVSFSTLLIIKALIELNSFCFFLASIISSITQLVAYSRFSSS